jgi:putative (di)nucleoside polyphosphate hydrolase
VGIVVLNEQWQVLALERIDKEQRKRGFRKGTGQWQMPQGGLDEGEEPDQAWQRELHEEICVTRQDVDLIGHYPTGSSTSSPRPTVEASEAKHGRGQAQRWYFASEIRVTVKVKRMIQRQEFIAHKWLTLSQLAEETGNAGASIQAHTTRR